MATDAAFGLRPVGHRTQGQYDGRFRRYYVGTSNTTNLGVGDVVKSSGTADTKGVPGVTPAAAGNNMRGVIIGVQLDRDVAKTEHPGYLPASTEGYVFVVDDPDVIFEVQEDSDGTTLAATDIGQTADLVIGTMSTTTGHSKTELDSSDAGTGAGVLILGLAQRQDVRNEGFTSNQVFEVLINEHELRGAVTAV